MLRAEEEGEVFRGAVEKGEGWKDDAHVGTGASWQGKMGSLWKEGNEASPTSAIRRASNKRSRRNEPSAFTRNRECAVGYERYHDAPSVCLG